MDGIIFNDLSDFEIPARSAGAYRVASTARSHGYNVKVIDFITYALTNNPSSLLDIVRKYTNKNTRLFGFSTTFLKYDKRILYFVKLLNKYFPHVQIIFGGQSDETLEFKKHFGDIARQVVGFGENEFTSMLGTVPTTQFKDSAPMFGTDDAITENEVLPLETSRGCRFKCKFCAYPLLGRNPNNLDYIRSHDSLYAELRHNYDTFGTTRYYMLCDTFNESHDKLSVIKKAIDKLGVNIEFSAYIRLDLLNAHPEQIDMLRDMGIKSAFFGIESLYDPAAKSIGKGMGRKKTITMLERLRDEWNDVHTLGSFIVGLPHDSVQTVTEWSDLINDESFPLDSYKIHGLGMRNNYGYIQSEFEKKAEAYGYELHNDDEWSNEYWTSAEAKHFADNIRDKLCPINKVSSWQALGLTGYGIEWNAIRQIKEIDLSNDYFVSLKNNAIEQYYKRL